MSNKENLTAYSQPIQSDEIPATRPVGLKAVRENGDVKLKPEDVLAANTKKLIDDYIVTQCHKIMQEQITKAIVRPPVMPGIVNVRDKMTSEEMDRLYPELPKLAASIAGLVADKVVKQLTTDFANDVNGFFDGNGHPTLPTSPNAMAFLTQPIRQTGATLPPAGLVMVMDIFRLSHVQLANLFNMAEGDILDYMTGRQIVPLGITEYFQMRVTRLIRGLAGVTGTPVMTTHDIFFEELEEEQYRRLMEAIKYFTDPQFAKVVDKAKEHKQKIAEEEASAKRKSYYRKEKWKQMEEARLRQSKECTQPQEQSAQPEPPPSEPHKEPTE